MGKKKKGRNTGPRNRPRTPAELAADKLRKGRPPIDWRPRRTLVSFRMTEAELRKLKRLAAKAGLTVTDYLRKAGGLDA